VEVRISDVPKKIKPGKLVPLALAIKNDIGDEYKVKARFFVKAAKGPWSLYLGTAEFDVKPNTDDVYKADMKFRMPPRAITLIAEVTVVDKEGKETTKTLKKRVSTA